MAKGKSQKSGARKSSPSVAPSSSAGRSGNAKSHKGIAGNPSALVFPVDTRFQQLARRTGGVSRDRAIKRAQLALEEIKPAYEQFLEREVTSLSELVKNVEAGRDEPGWLETASFRSRQLRDSAGSLGYELIAFVAGSFCELLDSVEAGSECNMESIVCHVDALMLARQESYRRMRPEQVPELTKGLQRVVKHVTI